MMLNSDENQLKKRLDPLNLDIAIYESLPADIVNFIDNCINLGIPNQSKCKFHPGDIVIKKHTSTKQVVADSYGITRRWKVITCPFGIVIGQMLVGKNKLGSLEVLNHPAKTWSTIEMDPNYVNSLILQDQGFDPFEELNASVKMRRSAAKFNKSISIRLKDIEHGYRFITSLKIGDKLWAASTPLELTVSPWLLGDSILDISDISVPTGRDITIAYDLITIKIQSSSLSQHTNIRLFSLIGQYVTTQEPYLLSNIKLK